MKYLADLQKFLHQHKNEQNAQPMEKYMKNRFKFLGIKSPERRSLLKDFYKEYGPPQREWIENIVVGLYSLKYREFHYTAMEMTDRLLKRTKPEDIYPLEYLLEYNQWWDSIDFIAVNPVGRWMKDNPQLQDKYFQRWNNSEDMWLNRTAILYQLKYRNNTDLDKLTNAILTHSSSKEFFHQKAIGWALREYAKTNSQWVIDFVQHYPLASLSKREALKHLQ